MFVCGAIDWHSTVEPGGYRFVGARSARWFIARGATSARRSGGTRYGMRGMWASSILVEQGHA
eukprot:1035699-Lingulodinium_polyedra.AAC.1